MATPRSAGKLVEDTGCIYFAQITNQEALSRLEQLYGSPDNVDIWVGGLLEEPVSGGRVGTS